MKLFGTSGIRGVYGEKTTPQLALELGRAIGTLDYKTVSIGRDTRLSGDLLKHALIAGLMSAGCSVTDFRYAPTPVVSYGTRKLGADCGIMITASHNPAEYNGFKLCNSEGKAFGQGDEAKVEKIIFEKGFKDASWDKVATEVDYYDVSADYVEEVAKRFKLEGEFKVLIDSANGAAFGISPLLLQKFGYDTISINEDADGSFPNRHPEPSHKNLEHSARLAKKNKCNIGFCHDGDADRMMAVDDKGSVVNFDKFLAFLCKKMVEESGKKTVVTTVDASMLVDEYLEGIKVIRARVGDVFVANEVEKHNACFGGEPSGSYIFPEFGLWPDGIYGIFKTLKFLEEEKRQMSEMLARIPEYPFSRTKLTCPNEKKEVVMAAIKSMIPEDAELSEVDGARFDFGDAIVLVRPSGTEPIIRVNVEAKDKERLKKLENEWHNKVKGAIK